MFSSQKKKKAKRCEEETFVVHNFNSEWRRWRANDEGRVKPTMATTKVEFFIKLSANYLCRFYRYWSQTQLKRSKQYITPRMRLRDWKMLRKSRKVHAVNGFAAARIDAAFVHAEQSKWVSTTNNEGNYSFPAKVPTTTHSRMKRKKNY